MPRFDATMDNTTKITTLIVSLVVIFPLITMVQIFADTLAWYAIATPVLVLGTLLICFLYRTKAYSLEPGKVIIHRQINNITLQMTDIEDVAIINLKEQGFGIRTFGVGGYWGYWGKFWYKQLGHVTFYATDRLKTILITKKEGSEGPKLVVISPDDAEGFVKAYHKLRKERH